MNDPYHIVKEEHDFGMPSCASTEMYDFVYQQPPPPPNNTAYFSTQNETEKRRVKSKLNDRSSVSHLYEGQSFPYRLWHLINNDYFDDVIHWSPDGNCIVMPDKNEFVDKVLRLKKERIFKTESMKSFIRQLNLYGFHKVQLEKDETFVHLLRHREKQNWPEDVFEHPFFKRGRPDLLERVKRRCKVKESKAVLEKINKVAGHDMVAPFNMQGNNMYEPRNKNVQCIPYPLYMGVPVQGDQSVPQYPNLVPSLDHCVDRKQAKRKLNFSEEKEERKRSPPQMSHQYSAPPFYVYPQPFINNYQPMPAPPMGWTIAQPNVGYGGPYIASCSENLNYFAPSNPQPAQPDYQKKLLHTNLNGLNSAETVPSPDSYLTHETTNNNEMKPSNIMRFCESHVFSPNGQQIFPSFPMLLDE